MLENIWHDLRFSSRVIRKNPSLTVVILLTLALGIGANSAIFSVINAVLLRPLPVEDPDKVVMLEENMPPRFQHFELSPLNFQSWQQQNTVFSSMGGYYIKGFNLVGSDRPERLSGAVISASIPSLLGVQPILGRTFTPDEEQFGRNHVLLLGEDIWRTHFGGSNSVVGSTLKLDGANYTVVGVMPRKFRFPDIAELWAPLAFSPDDLASRSNHYVWGVARLKPGVSLGQAQSEMSVIAKRLQQQFPETNKDWGANVFPLIDHYVANVRPALLVLTFAVGFVLIIASANIANILLARASIREKEIALRTSLGARRGDIVRQLLTESLLLALLGGALGLAVTWVSIKLVIQLAAGSVPRIEQATSDYRVLIFTLLLSVCTGLLFGLAPALRLSGTDVMRALKDKSGSDTKTRFRGLIMVSEVAFALVLAVGAGLLLRSFWRLVRVQPGFNAERVLTMRLVLPSAQFPQPAQRRAFMQQIQDKVRVLPGVDEVGASSAVPLTAVEDEGMFIEGRVPNTPDSGAPVNHYLVSPEYFRTMGISLVRGRLFSDADTEGSPPVAIINESIARHFFPNQDPIGKRIDISGPSYMRGIVGVVSDVKQAGLDSDTTPQVYEPYFQKPGSYFVLAVRSRAENAMLLAEPVRQVIQQVNSEEPVSRVITMQDIVATSFAQRRFVLQILTFFAAVALLLAATGIYGVVSYSVTRRTREIGVRMALGAQRSDVMKMVLKHGMGLTLLGLVIGFIGVLSVNRLLSSLLYDVGPFDLVTLGAVMLVLIVVSFTSCYIPARRAVRVDPLIAFRYE